MTSLHTWSYVFSTNYRPLFMTTSETHTSPFHFSSSPTMSSLCSGCAYNPWLPIARFYEQEQPALDFLRAHGVLPNSVECPRCRVSCKFREDRQQWYCSQTFKVPKTKKRRRCNFSVTDRKGTFLDNVHIPAWKIILFVNYWLDKHWNHETISKTISFSSRTSVDWRSFCSEVTHYWFYNQDPIGGEGVIVEIDESCFGHRKFNTGRLLSQIWVFGGIERVSKKLFVVPLINEDTGETQKRDKQTLVPLIEKYIRRGSVIISDCWKAYSGLEELGFTHRTINHSKNFVDPDDPTTHTQTIERLWRDVKEWTQRPGQRREYFFQYIARYLFIHSFSSDDSRLHKFFVQAAKLYEPQSGRIEGHPVHRAPIPEDPHDLPQDNCTHDSSIPQEPSTSSASN